MNKKDKEIKKLLMTLDSAPLPDKRKIFSNIKSTLPGVIPTEEVRPGAVKTSRPRFNPRPLVTACVAFILIGGGVAGIAVAADIAYYNEAVEYLTVNNISMEGMSRSEIKELYKNLSDSDFPIVPDSTDEQTQLPVTSEEVTDPPITTEQITSSESESATDTVQTVTDTETAKPDPDKKVYDSALIDFDEDITLSYDKICELVDECIEAYKANDEIKLGYFDVDRARQLGYIKAYVRKHGEAEFQATFEKSSADALKEAGEASTIKVNKDIVQGNYDKFTIDEYSTNYEQVIVSMLLDRLIATSPEIFGNTNSDSLVPYTVFETLSAHSDKISFEVSFGSGDVSEAVIFSFTGNDKTTVQYYAYDDNGNILEVKKIFPISGERETAEKLCYRDEPKIPSTGENTPSYLEALSAYRKWQTDIKEYLDSRNKEQ